jgi:hypothetical protein
MIISLLIIGFSIVLLVYWFRYSCLLLLRAESERVASAPAANDQRFASAGMWRELPAAPLDRLEEALNRDYRLLTYLLDHAAGLSGESLEDRILVLDYRVMSWYFCLTRALAPSQARRALSEMATVVAVLADRMGQQAAMRAEA